jgi:hypothetical protein
LAKFAVHLKAQITLGIPTGQDEAGLRQLARQLRADQIVVKRFMPYPLRSSGFVCRSSFGIDGRSAGPV